MIPDQWYVIFESDALKPGQPEAVVRMGERLVLWRDANGQPVCLDDRCAHRGVALSVGHIKNGNLACAYHGLQYDNQGVCVKAPCVGADGKIPGSMKTRRWVVREENGLIWLWWGAERTEYPPVPWIEEIPKDHRRGITKTEVWPFNYVRCVENHLDVHHWAFVHDSIMLAVGESFREFNVTVEDEGLTIKTQGTLQRTNKHGKIAQRGWDFKAYCRLPNLSLIQVTPKFKSLVVQTPIDDETTWILVRSFQTYSGIQPFKAMIDYYCITFLFSVPLHRQDFPLFHEQRPRQSGVGVNKLLPADAGIAKYLIARDRLLKEAKKKLAAEGSAMEEPWEAPLKEQRLPILQPAPAQQPSLLPAHARNIRTGAEARSGKVAAWVLACLTYPLLVPSLIATQLLAWWDAP
ncbi:MAG: aromatic ring-hydroxylating dioxygenase subunit alpha [Myxococcota bacterium]